MMTSTTIPGNDFLDILFSGRNKDYGAYALRRRYDQRVRNAIMGTASIALVIIGGYIVNNQVMASRTPIRSMVPVVDPIKLSEAVLPPEQLTPPPPPPPPSMPPPARANVAYVTPVVSSEALETEVPPVTALEHNSVGLTNTTGDINGIDADQLLPQAGAGGIVEAPVVTEREDRERIWTGGVEIMPSFPGGMEALGRYLSSHLHYPRMALENNISGTVYVQFVVDYEGNIKDIRLAGIPKGGGLDEEAMRVIEGMPKWKPGKQNGHPVSVLYNLPVRFAMKEI
jgi:protein TonB